MASAAGAGSDATGAQSASTGTEAGAADRADTAVQLTRGQADALDLQVGSRVWLRPSQHASVLAAR